jgi:hypothetical protein
MKIISKIGISILLLVNSYTALSQLSLSGEFRPRTEYRHGFKSLSQTDQDMALFTDQRTRFNVGFKGKNIETFLQVQDIRTWGSQSQLNSTDGLLSLHQAWAKTNIGGNWALKVGRQEIIYDDHRIFGNVGWAQQARSHDAALVQYSDSTVSMDIGFAFNQDGPQLTTNLYTVPKSYKSMQYIWLHKDFSKKFKASFLFLNNGQQATLLDTNGAVDDYKTNFSQTVGTHFIYKQDKWSFDGNAYYQMGSAGDWSETEISAYLVGFNFNYKAAKKLTTVLGFEMQSGTSQTDLTNEQNNSFNPFFGTNHKFNGLMDYFYVGNHLNNVGLSDVYVKLKYKQSKSFSIGGDVHLFYAAADVAHPNNTGSAIDADLGTEIDLYGSYKLNSEVMVKFGYSHMLASETMEVLKGGDKDETNNWAWLMVIFKPKFK